MRKKTRIFLYFSVFFSLFILFSCASTSSSKASEGTKIKSLSYNSLEEEPFYVQNHELFVEKKLSNGIPVIIKKSKYQNSCAVRLVIDSVPLSDPVKKSGLENITLELMKAGTSKYSSHYISSLEYTDSTTFMSKVHADYLEYGISSQKDRLETVLEVFAQTFTKPLLSQTDFESIITAEKSRSPNILDELYGILSEKDVYYAPLYVCENSSITYKDVKDFHSSLQNASRIRIVASGNFSDEDAENLFILLERNFGPLWKGKTSYKLPKKNAAEFDGSVIYRECKKGEPSCALGYARIPEPLSDEYLRYGLLSLFLDDNLYSLVKQKYSLASDAGTGVLLSKANIGLVSIFDISSLKNAQAVKDSVNDLVNEENLQKKLDSYKRVYVSFIMSSELSADRTLDQMALGLVYRNDAKDYIKRPFKVYQITPSQITEIYETCIKNNMNWVVKSTMTK